MNKNIFNLNNSKATKEEIERKWRAYLQEKELLEAQQFAMKTSGFVSGGSRSPETETPKIKNQTVSVVYTEYMSIPETPDYGIFKIVTANYGTQELYDEINTGLSSEEYSILSVDYIKLIS